MFAKLKKEKVMADINIQPRRKTVWPWVLSILALAVLAWVLLGVFNKNDRVAYDEGSVVDQNIEGDNSPGGATPRNPNADVTP
jgi:hypothetical protein